MDSRSVSAIGGNGRVFGEWFRRGGMLRCSAIYAGSLGEAVSAAGTLDVWDGLRSFIGVLSALDSASEKEVDENFRELARCARAVGAAKGGSAFDGTNTGGGLCGSANGNGGRDVAECAAASQGGDDLSRLSGPVQDQHQTDGLSTHYAGADKREDGANGVGHSVVAESVLGRLPRGPNFERNRRNRMAARERKRRGEAVSSGNIQSAFHLCHDDVRRELAVSRANRLIAENVQATERAKRNTFVVQSGDMDSEVRRHRAKITADIERNLVSIEKSHASLRSQDHGFAATVNGSSISPSSSVSLKEIRQCQEDLLDANETIESMRVFIENAGLEPPKSPKEQRREDRAVDIWTDNSENRALWEEAYSCYGIQDMADYGLPGKVRINRC